MDFNLRNKYKQKDKIRNKYKRDYRGYKRKNSRQEIKESPKELYTWGYHGKPSDYPLP